MFGIKKVYEKLCNVYDTMISHAVLTRETNEIKRDIKRVEMAQCEIETSVSIIHSRTRDIDDAVQALKDNNLDKLIEIVKANTEQVNSLVIKFDHLIENQKKIIEYMDVQDRLNADLLAVVDQYAPVKKIPKLPKKKPATT